MSSKSDPTRIPGQTDPAPGQRNPIPMAQPDARKPRIAAGQRPLTATEQARRQRNLSCIASDKPQATAGCSQLLDFTVFFDGTGNNRDQEMAKRIDRRALSNVAKLFDAHQAQVIGQRITRYIPGVGTPFPTIGDPGGRSGMGLGTGADKRIDHALDELDKAIKAVPAGVKLQLVTVNAFGFSRGAASARAFVRDLAARCIQASGGYAYSGIPLRVGFLGIFDTVCSAYSDMFTAMASKNGGHNGWAHDMRLPAMVEQCVHMTAGHEARIRFPLDSVRDGAIYPPNAREICYPGVHADVGGGYTPYEQGPRSTLSRFALNEMLSIGLTSGARLQPVNALRPEVRAEFEIDEAMHDAFNAYNQALGRSSGTLEQLQASHMELLHRWLRQRTQNPRTTDASKRLSERAAQIRQDWAALQAQVAAFNRKYRTPFLAPAVERTRHERNLKQIQDGYEELIQIDGARSDLAQEDAKVIADIEQLRHRKRRGEHLTLSQETMLRAWDNDTPLPAAVSRFFDLYTHDSVAHFDLDNSRLTSWRTIYFAGEKYSPT